MSPINSFAKSTPDSRRKVRHYSAITAAWYTNERCLFLDKKKLNEFRKYISIINHNLPPELKNDPKSVTIIHNKVKEFSQINQCNQDSSDLIHMSLDLAKYFNSKQRSRAFDAHPVTKIIKNATVASRLSNKCKVLPAQQRMDLFGSYFNIISAFDQHYQNSHTIGLLAKIAVKDAYLDPRINMKCDKNIEQFITDTYNVLIKYRYNPIDILKMRDK